MSNKSNIPSGAFTQVSAGQFHNCGVKSDGTLACWGNSYDGQLNNIPSGTFTQVSAGGQHTCAVKSDGTLACWGNNGLGQAPVISINPASLPAGTVNAAYSQTITASGGSATPYTFAIVSGALPTGLTLNTNGTLSGTPTAAGAFNFTVQALDANSIAGTRAYALTVK